MSTFKDLVNNGLINIGDIIGLKLSIKSLQTCNTQTNIDYLQQGISSFTNANIILNYTVVVFILLINNIVNLIGQMYAFFFMLILFLVFLSFYFYYKNDYNSKKDSLNKCLNDNYQ
jgi:hypothetical protein